ncbi:MAG TPA: ABATE domain-containing protein [Gaiellaceae bacterium]|nr:ABATE domain-containing protein [Gaiellaceae bacterium]
MVTADVEGTPLPSYRRLVDGLVLPVDIGGHAALDFCNTLAGHGEESPHDYLAGFDELALWARDAGLLTPHACAHARSLNAASPRTGARVAAEARALRSAAYDVFMRAPAADFATVQRFVQAAEGAVELVPEQGDALAAWRLPPAIGVRLPLHAAARAVGELLVSTRAREVRRCPGRGCGWLFLDRSGRRRWCSMASCGNREKARRFAQRARG